EEKIPALLEIDAHRIAVGAEIACDIGKKFLGEFRDQDILRRRELLADAAPRAGSRAEFIGRIFFQYRHAAREARRGFQEIGDRGADDAAANYYNIAGCFHEFSCPYKLGDIALSAISLYARSDRL